MLMGPLFRQTGFLLFSGNEGILLESTINAGKVESHLYRVDKRRNLLRII